MADLCPPGFWTTGGWSFSLHSGGGLVCASASARSAPCFRSRHEAVPRCSIGRQSSIFSRASATVGNQCWFTHSARKRPLKASMKALSVGFPDVRSPGSRFLHRPRGPRSRDTNSVP